jgi:predicted nucleotidyltransferase
MVERRAYSQDPIEPGDDSQKAIRTAIANMVKRLITEYSPQKVILFGSQIQGVPTHDSDVDLLIIKETSDRFIDRWVAVQQVLTGTHRGIPVETLVLTPKEVEQRLAVGDHFIRGILEKGELLYAA